jgi:limonene-1,2-epoxide hydrolase
MSVQLQKIEQFLHAFLAQDADSAVRFVTDDFRLRAIPHAPHELSGKEQLRAIIAHSNFGFERAIDEAKHRIVRSLESGGVVCQERVDCFRVGDKWFELPIVAIFEFRGDLIGVETDYFDSATYARMRESIKTSALGETN